MSEKRITSIGMRRVGGEDDPNAEVVLEIQYSDGTYKEIGRERLSANFSSWWKINDERMSYMPWA